MEKESYRQEELVPIVAELARRYAGYEHTSVTYEKAQALMEGVLYSINEYECSGRNVLCSDIPAREAYRIGQQIIRNKVEQLRLQYNDMMPGFEDYGMICLNDTIVRGIPEFLKRYDAAYAPQETLLTLDYPLLLDCCGLCGVDAVSSYLEAVRMEQDFLGKLGPTYVIEILTEYDIRYEILFENICEIVLLNLVGHMFLKKPVAEKGFRNEELKWMSELIGGWNRTELQDQIDTVIKKIVTQYYSENKKLFRYLECGIPNLTYRILNAVECGHLENVFLC